MPTGLIVGGWFASTVITKLINGLIDYAKDQKKMQLGLKDELKRLDKALPKIQAVVNAVDQGLLKEENTALEKWLWQLRDAADQADDVMDEMEYNSVKEDMVAKRSKVSKAASNFTTFLDRAFHKDPSLKKLKDTVKAIDDVASDVMDFYILVKDLANNQKEKDKSTINSRETSSLLDVKTRVFGRQNEAEAIIKNLLNPKRKTQEVNFAVLPIIGGGGVGKTTLAQHVYNAPEVKNHFGLRMWICVSNNFDVVLFTKKMYEIVFERKADFYSFDLIQTKLANELESKRFLVVFDDAWDDADDREWNKLFAPLKSGMSGSMILLTTRMETVARLTGPNLMDSTFLEGLEERDMWNLFEECAFGGEDPNDYMGLVEIGKCIVKKLKGNPLAARIVGGALYSDLTDVHWRSILESELWSIEQGKKGIMSALRLSYQHLPSQLKPCFSFCSIFPQDHVFIKNDLIYMWLALGLVPRDVNGEKKPEDVGSKYFEEMLKRSVFTPAQPVSTVQLGYPAYIYCSEKQLTGGYVMHDLMHDLSAFVSQGECFLSDTNKSVPIPSTVRHLYIRVGDYCDLNNLNNLKNIRTLILQFDDSDHPELVCILNKMLEGMTSLRILSLFPLTLREIPKSTCDLIHLRYLGLSSYMLDEFPQSMSRLLLMETIVCGGFGSDKHADVLVKLINLRHIIASETFVETIACIGKLTSLQELCFRVGKDSGFKISELGDMRELRFLSISNINDVNSHEEAKQANLKNKADLRELSLTWERISKADRCLSISNINDVNTHKEAEQANMKNKVGLRELSLKWETKYHELSLQRKVEEFDENVLDHLEPKCKLKALVIRNYMGGRPPFWASGSLSSLVKLEISDCPNLVTLDGGLLRNPDKAVALKELIITNCKELKMPENGLSEFISLKRLDISSCTKVNPLSVLVLLPPHELEFLRINSYFQDCVEKKSFVKLQTREAHLFVLDHPEDNLNWEVILSRMRDYIGKWPPTWSTQTLSKLDSVCIDGRPDAYKNNFSGLPHQISRMLKYITNCEATSDEICPPQDMACPSDMSVLEQIYFVTTHINCLQNLKKLTVVHCSKTCAMPSLPTTLKELRLYHLELVVIPNFFGYQSSDLWSLPSISSMEIQYCPNLASLAEGLLENPQQFAALVKITIWDCKNLMILPHGGFNKFITLKELDIRRCPMIQGQLVQECFLPSALQVLCIYSCGDLDVTLTKALESVQSLISLELYGCKNIKSLPSVEVFSRWKTLEKPNFAYRRELTSRESFHGLFSVKLLNIRNCPNLVSPITTPPAWKKDEIDGVGANATTQNRTASTQPTPTDPSSSAYTEQKHLLSVDEMYIDNPLLLSIEPIRSLSSVRNLTIAGFSGMQSSLSELPTFFLSLKVLRLCYLGLVDLPVPNLCINHNGDLGSLLPLVSMEIIQCSNLVSLAEGPFQKPQQFAALEKLKISDCEKLNKLPKGGFSKFVSLKELHIENCPEIEGQLVSECFLPSALQALCVYYCVGLEANLSKALGSVESPISLVLKSCFNIRSLPPREVFSRWKTLERLEFAWCDELTSLESLLGLSYVRLLKIRACPKLVSTITSLLCEIVEDDTIQTSNRPASTQPTPTDPSSSTNTEHKPLLSVDELIIDDPLLLYIEPIRSLSSVRKLTITHCSKMQSLPELPPIHEELSLYNCSPELKRRCEESGEDWPKLSHIPEVFISEAFFSGWYSNSKKRRQMPTD